MYMNTSYVQESPLLRHKRHRHRNHQRHKRHRHRPCIHASLIPHPPTLRVQGLGLFSLRFHIRPRTSSSRPGAGRSTRSIPVRALYRPYPRLHTQALHSTTTYQKPDTLAANPRHTQGTPTSDGACVLDLAWRSLECHQRQCPLIVKVVFATRNQHPDPSTLPYLVCEYTWSHYISRSNNTHIALI